MTQNQSQNSAHQSLVVQCLLEEYKECAECFRHTYATIWQSGVLFATFSAALFGFFFSFQNLNVYISILPFISLASIIAWWAMIFEPMNNYGDKRAGRCKEIEEELSKIVLGLKMNHFSTYEASKSRIFRVRNGTRILATIIIILMIILILYFVFPTQ